MAVIGECGQGSHVFHVWGRKVCVCVFESFGFRCRMAAALLTFVCIYWEAAL